MRQLKSILILAMVMFGATISVLALPPYDATATVIINDISILKVNATSVPTFVVDDPTVAGEMPKITPSGGLTYLQYTVVVGTGITKKITAQSDKLMPKGLKMYIWAAVPTGTGGVGTPVAGGLMVDSALALAPASLITGITSCATGSGTTQGPAIYYTLSIDAASFNEMITQTIQTYTITYTLLDV